MARQRKVLPARKPRDRSGDDDSLLLRSAESLGRVIGALQRQLDSATRRLSQPTGNGAVSAARSRTARKSIATKRKRAGVTRQQPLRKATVRQANKKR